MIFLKNIIILTGPTGIGKTEISLEIAKKLNTEIISADSMQIYKKMDIGTAKIDLKSTEIIHHMVDIINPEDNFSVKNFQQRAFIEIDNIHKKNKIPLIVGGTGLYINSIVYKLIFNEESNNDNLRNELNLICEEKGLQFLYEYLKSLDIEVANKIEKNNKNRVIRAIEIIKSGNKIGNDFREENKDYNFIFIGLNMNRQKLYDKINSRVDNMIKLGLIDEVRKLLDDGLPLESQSLKAIGYREVIDYFNNKTSYDEMVELIKRNSRRYAKRQLTWFRRDDRIKWFDREESNLIFKINSYIGERLGENL